VCLWCVYVCGVCVCGVVCVVWCVHMCVVCVCGVWCVVWCVRMCVVCGVCCGVCICVWCVNVCGFRPSSVVEDCTYSKRHLSNIYCCLLASGYEVVLSTSYPLASRQQYLFDKCLLLS